MSGTVYNGKSIRFKALLFGISAVQVMHFDPFTVRCKAVIEIKKVMWLITYRGDDAIIYLSGSFVLPQIGRKKPFTVSLRQSREIGKIDETI